MTLQILTTKIGIPLVRSEQVTRPRLIERLDEVTRYPLTLVTAPAGFGKTTLLSTWARHSLIPVAWVSLDASDSDPLRFWSYCVSALQTIHPEVGRETLNHLNPASPDNYLIPLINDLAARSDQWVLALDDFHTIHHPAILEGLAFLAEHLPPEFHLLIASRIEPPLPLARLRARGQLLELHAADLRFTAGETETFLNRIMRLSLSDEQAAALDDYTEGWAAALQLAGLSMQRSTNADSFIRSFTERSPLAVMDYLAGEVLNQQPPDVRDFLLRTSVLHQLSPSLCEAVTGQENSRELLLYLVRANLFIVQLDENQQVYRYHHLFADFLREQLRAENPSAEWESCRRASLWYARSGMRVEAIDYALEGHDYDRAVMLIEQYGQKALHLGLSVSQRWFQALPESLLLSRPPLALHYAWMLVILNQRDRAERYIQHVAETGLLSGEIATLRTFAAARQGNLSQTVELSRLALESLPEDDQNMRGVTCLSLASSHLWSGSWSAAREALSSFEPTGNEAQSQHFKAAFLGHWGLLYLIEGHLQQAWEAFRRMLELADENEPFNGVGYLGLGEILREWNRLDEAEQNIRTGLERIGPIEGDGIRAYGYLALARLYAAKEETMEAAAYFEEAEETARRTEAPLLIAEVTARRIQWQIAQNSLAAPIRWAQMKTDRATVQEQITLARIWMAQKKFDPAADLLRTIETGESLRSQIEVLVLQAMLTQGLDTLAHALKLAEAEGYLRLFADEGPAQIALLRRVFERQRKTIESGPSPAYIRDVLLACGCGAEIDLPQPNGNGLYDPLSPRELDVLRLMAEGLSNEDIAAQLVISIGTARKHASNIFSKLNAHSRIEAVARARKLNLLG